jgi:hypothetical protein
MVALGAHKVELAFLGTAAALGGAALLLASGKALFWARYFLRWNPQERDRVSREPLDPSLKLAPSSADWLALIGLETKRDPDRGIRLAERLLGASRRKTMAVELLSSMAAIVGLAGSLISLGELRDPGRGPGPGLGESLSWTLAPLLVGTAIFVVAQGALGLFRSWGDALRDGVFQVSAAARRPPVRDDGAGGLPLPGAVVTMAVQLPPAQPGLPPALAPPGPKLKLGRRPLERPTTGSFLDSLRSGGVLLACFLASLLLHTVVFFAAQRLDSASNPGKAGDRDGVFLAAIVDPSKPVPAPPEEPQREEPRVARETPPLPEPVPPPPPPPDPVREAVQPEAENKPLTEQPKAAAPAEEAKPSPPPPAAPPREAAPEAAEPPSRLAEAKEREAAKSTPASPAPRVTETPPEVPAIPQVPAGPPPAAPSPAAPAEVRSAAPAAERAPLGEVLGQGPRSRSPEEREARSPSDSGQGSAAISTTKEYRQFLAREMKSGAAEGQYVPNLRFGDNQAQENREIMRYFGMELIAYPKNQKFYVYIDPEQGLYSRSNDFSYIRNFSSRAIFRNSPYFDALRAEAARRVGVEPQSLVMAQLLKPSSAAYIGWKEAECAKRAGVVLEEVEACEATFVKSPFGLWIVRIDRLLMKDGRALPVRDFEWAKVAGAAGGEK